MYSIKDREGSPLVSGVEAGVCVEAWPFAVVRDFPGEVIALVGDEEDARRIVDLLNVAEEG